MHVFEKSQTSLKVLGIAVALSVIHFGAVSAWAKEKRSLASTKSKGLSSKEGNVSPPAKSKSGGGAEGESAAERSMEKPLDISDLETKYWAPKDTDFSVVQNRTYTKEKRFSLSVSGGLLVNDGYSSGYLLGVAANRYFSERYGVEVSFVRADLKNNDPTDKLRDFGGGVQPDFGRMKSYYGVGFNWVPFYAKMSVLGSRIVYFDMAITPTLGMMNYEQIVRSGNLSKSAFSYGVDLTQYFFFTNHLSLRIDLKNKWFQEDVARYYNSGGIATGKTFRTKTTNTTLFLMGVNFFF